MNEMLGYNIDLLITVTSVSIISPSDRHTTDQPSRVTAAILVIQSFVHFHLIMDSDYVNNVIEDILQNDIWHHRPNLPNFA